MSGTYAEECCDNFAKAINTVYSVNYLRLPTATDVKRVLKLHKAIHNIDGMFGSLDCTHTYWKNCPKAWQQSFLGKEDKPSIAMEAVADFNLFFWHASYGYTGALNDLIILSLSPLLDRMLDGTFHALEEEAGVVPFEVSGELFNNIFFLVDGIYPKYSRFVRGIKEPITQTEKYYTAWQEAARKDIERAFGVLKNTWQFVDRPIHVLNLQAIADKIQCCLILHNMLVTDRVMEGPNYNYTEQYDPCHHVIVEGNGSVQQPIDLVGVQNRAADEPRMAIGVANTPRTVRNGMTRAERFQELDDREENKRLHSAIMDIFSRSH